MSNILIIEDEESVANVLKAYLEKDKYNVSVCNSISGSIKSKITS